MSPTKHEIWPGSQYWRISIVSYNFLGQRSTHKPQLPLGCPMYSKVLGVKQFWAMLRISSLAKKSRHFSNFPLIYVSLRNTVFSQNTIEWKDNWDCKLTWQLKLLFRSFCSRGGHSLIEHKELLVELEPVLSLRRKWTVSSSEDLEKYVKVFEE